MSDTASLSSALELFFDAPARSAPPADLAEPMPIPPLTLPSPPVGKPRAVVKPAPPKESPATPTTTPVSRRAALHAYLPVIQAAERDALPTQTVCMGGTDYEINAYVRAIADALQDPFQDENVYRTDWLRNLRRLQAWYERGCPGALTVNGGCRG